jgi:phytoene synthase
MTNFLQDPERELALSYAPARAIRCLRALWRLDEKLGSIIAGASEATIGEMQLLWWREAVEGLDLTVPAEPLLADIASALETTGLAGSEWGALADGWFALLQPSVEQDDLQRFADQRGARLFDISAAILVPDKKITLASAGQGWALSDLSFRAQDPALQTLAQSMASNFFLPNEYRRWPRALRPLGALVVVARRDMIRARRRRRLGSPSRVGRMAWHRLTGL